MSRHDSRHRELRLVVVETRKSGGLFPAGSRYLPAPTGTQAYASLGETRPSEDRALPERMTR